MTPKGIFFIFITKELFHYLVCSKFFSPCVSLHNSKVFNDNKLRQITRVNMRRELRSHDSGSGDRFDDFKLSG